MSNNHKALATTAGAGAAKAMKPYIDISGQGPGRPIVNLYLHGSGNNLNFGGLQCLGQSAGAWTDTIRTQAEIIAAQQRTIDRLITMLERQTIAQH